MPFCSAFGMGVGVRDRLICADTRWMKIVGLHHVQLAMPRGEEASATEFYEGLLGIPRVAWNLGIP